jgi:hypothetical protein
MKEGLGNVMDPDLERLADAEAYELDDRSLAARGT